MIGSYRGSSGAERALRMVVEAMVMPPGVDARLHWPAFGNAGTGPLIAYQRRSSRYEVGQTWRLLDVDELAFDIFIWSSNENQVMMIMDAFESGFNAFPIASGLGVVRSQLQAAQDEDDNSQAAVDAAAAGLATVNRIADLVGVDLSAAIGPAVSVRAQEDKLAAINQQLASLSRRARTADWRMVINALAVLMARFAKIPPYSFRPLDCRDLTAPEIFQLGLSGRVFSVAMEYTAM